MLLPLNLDIGFIHFSSSKFDKGFFHILVCSGKSWYGSHEFHDYTISFAHLDIGDYSEDSKLRLR